MRKRGVILGATVILFLFSSWLLLAEEINIQVRFFEGTWMGDQLGLNQVEILFFLLIISTIREGKNI